MTVVSISISDLNNTKLSADVMTLEATPEEIAKLQEVIKSINERIKHKLPNLATDLCRVCRKDGCTQYVVHCGAFHTECYETHKVKCQFCK